MRKRQFISSKCFEWVWQRLRDYECLILVLHGDAPDNQRRNREEKCVIKLQKKSKDTGHQDPVSLIDK